jgi:hypothetical protein
VAHVAELADVKLRMEEMRQIKPKTGINFVRIFAKSHMSQVEQPASREVI